MQNLDDIQGTWEKKTVNHLIEDKSIVHYHLINYYLVIHMLAGILVDKRGFSSWVCKLIFGTLSSDLFKYWDLDKWRIKAQIKKNCLKENNLIFGKSQLKSKIKSIFYVEENATIFSLPLLSLSLFLIFIFIYFFN